MRFARLDVLVIGADIADMREGEGDHLLRVARVGHHLLVAGHRGVEAQLADRLPFRAEALAPHRAAVGEHHDSVAPSGCGGACGGVRRPWAGRAFRQGFTSDVAKALPLCALGLRVNAGQRENRYASGDSP